MTRLTTVAALAGVFVLGAAPARADVVLQWNAIMVNTVAAQNPFAQARFAAIVQLAVFEAVNACAPRYRPYLGTIDAPAGASPEAAAIAAAHGVLAQYFPASRPALDAARAQSLAAIPDGSSKFNGISVGEAAAAAMIALRSADGALPPEVFLPATTEAGTWQPTPPAFGPGVLLHWRNLTPFGIESSHQFRSAAPPSLRSKRYTRDYDEVYRVGSASSQERPQGRADVAVFYNAAAAVHVWNLALAQVSAVRGWSVSQNARAFALLNMAISDGLVSSMETKYHYIFWRPVTAIRAGDADGNPHTDGDPAWTPFIPTPAFPSYPSAHAAASYAARDVAERLAGSDGFVVTLSHPAVAGLQLTYLSFRDITSDIDDARVFGGIHFRFDQEAGAEQGRAVGAYIVRHWLRRLRGHDERH
jgi:hypothetical protein